jgi:TRAP transporter TAXI family solute receptor
MTVSNNPASQPRPRTWRRVLTWSVAGSLVLLGLIVWLTSVLHPLPPRRLTLACGPEGSSYQVFGKRYQKELLKQGIHLRLLTTAGGVENLELLSKPGSGVDMGFVEAGVTATTEAEDSDLASLGTLCYEPIWFFTRNITSDRGLHSLRGKRVAVGPEGSSSRAVLQQMLKRHAVDVNSFKLLTLTTEASADALLKGQIDAAVLVNTWASPVVRTLVKANGIDVANFSRADAYVALFPTLTKLNFPAGVADLEKDKPNRDITLLATKSSLIVRADLHPALQYLILEMIAGVHSRAGIFQEAGEFPAAEALDIPLSPEARHYYKSGRPFLQRYLPFWIAAWAEQLVLLLLPIAAVGYPLLKGIMSLYGWGMQRKIFSLYGELHWLETEIDKLGGAAPSGELLTRMQKLEVRVRRVKVSANYMPLLYSLKDTLANVRRRLG